MRRPLSWLAAKATIVMPCCVAIGLILPDLAAFFRPAITPLVWGLLTVAMVRTDWPALQHLAGRPLRVGLAVFFLMAGLALLVAPAARLSGLPAGLAIAVSMMCLCPPITSAPALAPILGLNQPLSLVAAVVGLLVAPLTLPPLALHLLAVDLNVSVLDLMIRLGALVGSALAAALVVRRALKGKLGGFSTPIDGLGVALLVLFAIAIFDGVTAQIIANPLRVATFVGAAFAAHAVFQIIAIAAFMRLGRRDALTMGFLAGTRNMGLLLAVLPATADPSIFLFIATAQFPIYMMPTLLRPLYARLLKSPPPSGSLAKADDGR